MDPFLQENHTTYIKPSSLSKSQTEAKLTAIFICCICLRELTELLVASRRGFSLLTAASCRLKEIYRRFRSQPSPLRRW